MSSTDEAFERYVVAEVEVMLRVARTLTRNYADAEDLVQDTMIRAYRAIDRFDGQYPRAWLLTILRNTNINRNRRRRPELLNDPDTQLERLVSPVDGDGSDQPDRFVDLEFSAETETALADLSDDHAEIIELVDIDGLSYQEAADVVGVPIGTVMSRLHRARKKIRDQLHVAGVAPKLAKTQTSHP